MLGSSVSTRPPNQFGGSVVAEGHSIHTWLGTIDLWRSALLWVRYSSEGLVYGLNDSITSLLEIDMSWNLLKVDGIDATVIINHPKSWSEQWAATLMVSTRKGWDRVQGRFVARTRSSYVGLRSQFGKADYYASLRNSCTELNYTSLERDWWTSTEQKATAW